jgi:hypothetical protein
MRAAMIAWRKGPARDNGHFVRLMMVPVMRHSINAGGGDFIARLKFFVSHMLFSDLLLMKAGLD